KLMQILQQPALPQGLLNFLPRDPKQIPHYLLHHKDTHFLTFTPSQATPTPIYQPTPLLQQPQHFLKPLIPHIPAKHPILLHNNLHTHLAAE
ncbi:aldehyde dehydrogenase family protein, partial [Staphylococcus epidermidis]|uniref:aldehyde dehydrogenase family protein n=1 Tax=Staphylococcus epidermidis TaxID=1282 RepID=UPI0011A4E5A7